VNVRPLIGLSQISWLPFPLRTKVQPAAFKSLDSSG
jgi:hypothetical protein